MPKPNSRPQPEPGPGPRSSTPASCTIRRRCQAGSGRVRHRNGCLRSELHGFPQPRTAAAGMRLWPAHASAAGAGHLHKPFRVRVFRAAACRPGRPIQSGGVGWHQIQYHYGRIPRLRADPAVHPRGRAVHGNEPGSGRPPASTAAGRGAGHFCRVPEGRPQLAVSPVRRNPYRGAGRRGWGERSAVRRVRGAAGRRSGRDDGHPGTADRVPAPWPRRFCGCDRFRW
jgi:hypothetical protein